MIKDRNTYVNVYAKVKYYVHLIMYALGTTSTYIIADGKKIVHFHALCVKSYKFYAIAFG